MTIGFLAACYPWTKALHIISMVAWMAGMFYLPRLYVYHCETRPGSAESERFKVMERRLLKQILNPAMIATWTFGILLVLTPGVLDWSAGWWHVKLACGHRHVRPARRIVAVEEGLPSRSEPTLRAVLPDRQRNPDPAAGADRHHGDGPPVLIHPRPLDTSPRPTISGAGDH